MTDEILKHAQLFNDRQNRYLKDFEQPLPFPNYLIGLLPRQSVAGVDLNRFQEDELVDADAMYAAGIRFAIIEACWGLWQPPSFAEFWPPLVDAGIIVMGYGFFRGDQRGSDQANFLLETVRPMYEAQGYWMPLFSDVERFTNDPSTVTQRVTNWRAWVTAIRAGNARPGAYSNIPSWTGLMNNEPLPADVLGWTAHYTSSTDPLIPIGWQKAQTPFHQYGVATKYLWCPPVDGMLSDVDVDRFYGSEADLLNLRSNIVVPPVEPDPEPSDDWQAIFDALNTINVKLDTSLANQADILTKLDGLDDLPPPPTPTPQPALTVRVTRDPKANANEVVGMNDSESGPKPILDLIDPKVSFNLGAIVPCVRYWSKDEVNGTFGFYQVSVKGPAGQDMYLREMDVTQV